MKHAQSIPAEGMNSHPEQKEDRLNRAAAGIRDLLDPRLSAETFTPTLRRGYPDP